HSLPRPWPYTPRFRSADAAAEWDLAQRHKELGIITEAEYLAAQIAWLRAEQDWLTAQRTLEVRRRDLARLLGLDDVAGYEFEDRSEEHTSELQSRENL